MSLAIKVGRASSQGGVRPGTRVTAGDPGLGSFLKRVGRAAAGFATGGVGGAIVGFAANGRPKGVPVPQPGIPLPGPFRLRPGALLPGGEPAFVREKVACPSGFHPNKSDYFLRDGTFVPAGTRCVKNRSRNPLNPRALRRAIGRVDGAKVWQSKLAEISTGKFTAAGNRKTC